MKFVIDCLGGDNSPNANVEGALNSLEKHKDLDFIFVGNEDEIRPLVPVELLSSGRVAIEHAPDVITGEDRPVEAVRHKKSSSLIRSVELLRTDDSVNALVSTGATGALVAAATLRIGKIDGIRRPAFCPLLPTMNGGIVGVCDSGANVDISPEQLVQFAVMGSRYLESAFGVENPRVALLNIGTESEKGDKLRREAYALLSRIDCVNFVGNMESRDLLSGKYDLVVCDGFAGNVLVKSTEGTALEILKKLKRSIAKKFRYKLGALLMRKLFMEQRAFFDYQNYGGSVLLGAEKTIVKGHGSGNAASVAVCIDQAYRMQTSHLNERIRDSMASIAFSAESPDRKDN